MINDPGEMTENISLLELKKNDTVYSWNEKNTIFAKAEVQPQKALFSQIGVGAKAVTFTVWKQDITLDNAFSWCGKHCFLTDINEVGRMYYEITAALVEPKTCILERQDETTDEYNGSNRSAPKAVYTFPGCIVEKYMGFQKLNPQSRVEAKYVLVTPKVIGLSIGDLIEADGKTYNVQLAHMLDDFKNEYEISIVGEG